MAAQRAKSSALSTLSWASGRGGFVTKDAIENSSGWLYR
jgi:hypothetical protein